MTHPSDDHLSLLLERAANRLQINPPPTQHILATHQRAQRRQTITRFICVAVAAIVVIAGATAGIWTGDAGRSIRAGQGAAGGGARAPQPDKAPEFRVRGDRAPIVLPAFSYCVSGSCASGPQPGKLTSVGRAPTVLVEPPQPGWTVTATLHKFGAPCQTKYTVSVTKMSESRWQLQPAGPADEYEVRLWSEGPTGGSAAATFRWTTTNDTPASPEPC